MCMFDHVTHVVTYRSYVINARMTFSRNLSRSWCSRKMCQLWNAFIFAVGSVYHNVVGSRSLAIRSGVQVETRMCGLT